MKKADQQDLLRQVISKAWDDEPFKEELIANPVEAIEKLTGKKVQQPEGVTLIVRDQTDHHTIFINIPQKQNLDNSELSEEQLESIAGGIDPNPPIGPLGPLLLVDLPKTT